MVGRRSDRRSKGHDTAERKHGDLWTRKAKKAIKGRGGLKLRGGWGPPQGFEAYLLALRWVQVQVQGRRRSEQARGQ